MTPIHPIYKENIQGYSNFNREKIDIKKDFPQKSKARDQKQNYRMNETKSHSGGVKICQGVSFAFFGAFWAPYLVKLGQNLWWYAFYTWFLVI